MDRKFQATSAPKRNQFLLIREYVDDVIDNFRASVARLGMPKPLENVADNWRAYGCSHDIYEATPETVPALTRMRTLGRLTSPSRS